MADEFVPTPAAEYPVIKTLDLEMPSGARVRVRRPSFFNLMEHGLVPAKVMKLVARRDMGKVELSDAEMYAILDFLVAASYVSPKVSTARKADHIYIHDIPDEDRMTVISALGLREAI
jgi:hypothetical protein